MSHIIIDSTELGQMKAKLLNDKNPNTVKNVVDSLPIDFNLYRWGDCLYGKIPLKMPAENPQIDCKVGDVGYWVHGEALVIFFGKTPHSTDDNPKAASDVNIFAKIEGDTLAFKKVKNLIGSLIKK